MKKHISFIVLLAVVISLSGVGSVLAVEPSVLTNTSVPTVSQTGEPSVMPANREKKPDWQKDPKVMGVPVSQEVLKNRLIEIEKLKNLTDAEREKIKLEREKFRLEVETKREELKNKIESWKANIASEKDKVKAKLKEERLSGREKALEAFDKVTKRVEEGKSKIKESIAKLKAKGVDTAKAEELLSQVDKKLDAIKLKVVEINTLLTSSPDKLPEATKAKIKTLKDEIQVLLREARALLKEAVKSLKDSAKAKLGSRSISGNLEKSPENENEVEKD